MWIELLIVKAPYKLIWFSIKNTNMQYFRTNSKYSTKQNYDMISINLLLLEINFINGYIRPDNCWWFETMILCVFVLRCVKRYQDPTKIFKECKNWKMNITYSYVLKEVVMFWNCCQIFGSSGFIHLNALKKNALWPPFVFL